MNVDGVITNLRTLIDYVNHAEKLTAVDGYLLDIQGYALMLLAEQGPGLGEIVEIGSFKGKSTCWLALGAMRAGRERVTAVDHFGGSEEHQRGASHEDQDLTKDGSTQPTFEQNIRTAGVKDYVNVIAAPSEEGVQGWNKPIRLLFIDGDHSYEASKRDFDSWVPHVVPGGIILLHDVGHWPGVTRFYQELMGAASEYAELFSLQGMQAIQKNL